MNQSDNFSTPPVHRIPLSKLMLIGAGIALTVILIFLISGGWFTQKSRPEWPAFWMVKPLIVVPLAGAGGGALFYFLDFLKYQGGWKTALAYLIGIIGYVIALWLGTVLGLNGVWWH